MAGKCGKEHSSRQTGSKEKGILMLSCLSPFTVLIWSNTHVLTYILVGPPSLINHFWKVSQKYSRVMLSQSCKLFLIKLTVRINNQKPFLSLSLSLSHSHLLIYFFPLRFISPHQGMRNFMSFVVTCTVS